MSECPCYKGRVDCPKRHKDCHATCEEFKDWRAEKDVENELKRNKDGEYLDYIIPSRRKWIRRKNEKNRT